MNIYIISLVDDCVRRNEISTKLQSMNLKYEFIDAVYGRSLDISFLDDLNKLGKIVNRGYNASHGEIGCSLSHIKAIKKIVNENKDWVCILEDDVNIDNRFKEFILNVDINNLNDECLYVLGGQNGLITERFISKSIFNKIILGGQKFSKVVRSEKSVNRACCYLVSKKMAYKYIELSNENYFLADDWMVLYKADVFKEIYLANFIDHPLDLSFSNLEKERIKGEDNKSKFKKSKLYALIKNIYFFYRYIKAQLNRVLG